MGLTELAQKAHEEHTSTHRAQSQAAYESKLAKVLGNSWDSLWSFTPLKHDVPAIDEHEIVRSSPLHIRAISDGIAFVYTSHNSRDTGWGVERTCPSCGAKVKRSFYSLPSLGEELAQEKAGKPLASYIHTCYESAAKSIAFELGYLARSNNISPQQLAQMALQHVRY